MKNFIKEFYYFFLKNVYASIYGIILVLIIFFTNYISIDFLSRYDLIFIVVVLLQLILIKFKIETKKEFLTIMVFHIIATIMEVYKTSGAIGSWKYPGVEMSLFVIGNVPLFTGFMYSAVGSYIGRASKSLNLKYINYPKNRYAIILSVLIYINFFSHHYIWDIRYILIIASLIIFGKTTMEFKVYKKVRKIHFLLSGLLTAICVWIAENISTFYEIRLYPNQELSRQLVSFSKMTSWYLLLIVSFTIISTLNSGKFRFGK